MAIGDPFTTAVPAVGAIGPQFATDINAILTEVIARLSVKVPVSSVNFNSNLNLAGSTFTNVGSITLVNSPTSPAATPINRVTAFNGDFWWVSPAGPVQVTTGATLNAAAVGGITGTYGGANPAQFRYDSVNTRYDAYANFSTGTWAYVRALGFDIAGGATSTAFARLAFLGTLNRTFTLPTDFASTADNKPLYIDSSGQIIVGHTSSKSFTYSAAGMSAAVATQLAMTASTAVSATAGSVVAFKSIDGLPQGFQIASFKVSFNKGTAALFGCILRRVNMGTQVSANIASFTTTTTGVQTVTTALGVADTVAAGFGYEVEVDFSTSGAESICGFEIIGTMPR